MIGKSGQSGLAAVDQSVLGQPPRLYIDRASDPEGMKYKMYFISIIEKSDLKGVFRSRLSILGQSPSRPTTNVTFLQEEDWQCRKYVMVFYMQGGESRFIKAFRVIASVTINDQEIGNDLDWFTGVKPVRVRSLISDTMTDGKASDCL